ncbi:MAG: hypothetical protein R3A79_21820 [Nannocystaceae bacterium]
MRLAHALTSMRAAKLGALSLLAGVALGVACGGPRDCRYDPYCGGGGIGAFCDRNADCFDGYCCEKDQCSGGMCTFQCDNDGECPAGMACEHSACFFTCASDADCLPDQKCKHDNPGVCEWD